MARKKKVDPAGDLFIEDSGQLKLVDKSAEHEALESEKVECLGMTFNSENARREHFLGLLADKLKDPGFRRTPGFPIAEDEDILRLSDPPYYTACPNPFVENFVTAHMSRARENEYTLAPYATDVAEPKNDIVYSAHTYHTKVPPRAIAKYMLHYTKPGDLVLDSFCGTGMTGVAARLCSDQALAFECGGQAGPRTPILCDLSPAATFISSVYLNPPDPDLFDIESKKLLNRVDSEVGSLWKIDHAGGHAEIEFQVWLEIFGCPHCQAAIAPQQVVEATLDIGTAKELSCPRCGGLVSKAPSRKSNATKLERHLQIVPDNGVGGTRKEIRRDPVITQIQSKNERNRILLNDRQKETLKSLTHDSPHWYPTEPLIEGERFVLKDCNTAYGITRIHHFYLPRQLKTYSALWHAANSTSDTNLRNAIMFFVQSNGLGMTIMNRFGPTHYSQVNKYFSGTLYIPSVIAESAPRYTYRNKRKRLVKAFSALHRYSYEKPHLISTQSATTLHGIPSESIDYAFIDPPFGRNLQYSELNQIWEAWLRVKTERTEEAVIDSTLKKDVSEYSNLMKQSFVELYRVLKENRWITVEFHNSSNAVWLAIQEGLVSAGFVVADVRILDKEKETYKQARQGLLKKDLVISAYKPSAALEDLARIRGGTQETAWEFVKHHLLNLPVLVLANGVAEVNPERRVHMLFDRMVAFHVQRSLSIPFTLSEFRQKLEEELPSRDGMYFLSDQISEYDRRRMSVVALRQLSLYPADEESAILWLRQQLIAKPQSYQDLTPVFLQEIKAWPRHEQRIELLELLEGNFLKFDGKGKIPSQIHSYLSTNYKDLRKLSKESPILIAKAKDRWYVPDPKKQSDLEKTRNKQLLREFEDFKTTKERRLKVFRTEAVRAGFKAAYDANDYQTIIDVAAKLPETVLQEDEKLLMYFDVASTRLGMD